MSLLDITPTTPRNPFAEGAALPTTVETRNSMYVITDTPWMVGTPGEVVVSCTEGTFAGESWRVPIEAVVLTRSHLHVGGIGLRTTQPLKVNGYPVETWA